MSPHASATDTIQIYLFNCVHSNLEQLSFRLTRARTILWEYIVVATQTWRVEVFGLFCFAS